MYWMAGIWYLNALYDYKFAIKYDNLCRVLQQKNRSIMHYTVYVKYSKN